MSQFTIFTQNHPIGYGPNTVSNGLTSRPQYWGYYRQKTYPLLRQSRSAL